MIRITFMGSIRIFDEWILFELAVVAGIFSDVGLLIGVLAAGVDAKHSTDDQMASG